MDVEVEEPVFLMYTFCKEKIHFSEHGNYWS